MSLLHLHPLLLPSPPLTSDLRITTTTTHHRRQLTINCQTKKNPTTTTTTTLPQTLAISSGLISTPIIAWSLYTLQTTGCGLPPGPVGSIGALEGISYLATVAIVGWSVYTKAKTGSGLPSGPFGLLGAVEGFSYLSLAAIITVFGLQIVTKGSLPGPLPPAQTSVGQSSGKATSKDGLSAGSITQEIIKIHSPQIHSPVIITPLQPSASLWITDDLETTIQMEWGIGVKKKRGKRKRRGQRQDIKEDNFDDPSLSFLSRIKVEPTSECDLASPPQDANKFSQATDGLKCSELTRIFDMISNNEHASIFRRRLDSQKRARYRMMVRQHMDLDAIKCRIDKQTITSTKELYRDFLLLATNAAIFYSRNTREHKYAVLLQGVIKQLITESKKTSIHSQAPAIVTTSSASANVPQILPPKINSKKPKIFNAENQKSLEKSKTDESVTKPVPRSSKTSKPKTSHPAQKKINHQARNANDVSRKQPQTKSASVKSLNTKNGSLQQALSKLTSTNALSSMDGSTHQIQIKPVNGSKERKRARKL